ncbi:MAG: hypothetical protein ACRCW4_17595 [Candidatus Neomicrothrix subdominans]
MLTTVDCYGVSWPTEADAARALRSRPARADMVTAWCPACGGWENRRNDRASLDRVAAAAR